MVQTLEAIKGGGGSIKVGTRGTISALMTRELESIKSGPKTPISPRTKNRAAVVVSISCKATAPKRPQARKSMDGASSSGSFSCTEDRCPEISRKTKDYTRKNHRIPMLGTDCVSAETTPTRPKPERRGHNIVEIVDIRCGNPDRAWVSPIAKLKKLGFSKLSESII